MQEDLLTTEQVAQCLNVDNFTACRPVARKGISAFRVENQGLKRSILERRLRKNMNTS